MKNKIKTYTIVVSYEDGESPQPGITPLQDYLKGATVTAFQSGDMLNRLDTALARIRGLSSVGAARAWRFNLTVSHP